MDENIKKQIINYLYKCINLSKYKYVIINTEDDLNILLKQKYYITINYQGINCLFVFFKIVDKYYSCFIDRKTLTYNISQINIDNVKIYSINFDFDKELYKGTIFDGIYIKKDKKFIINDIYMFMGNDLSEEKIKNKYLNINAYINNSKKNNNIDISLNKLYHIFDINEVVSNNIDTNIKGYVFYPEISGIKLIFMINKKIDNNNLHINNEKNNNHTYTNNNEEFEDNHGEDNKHKNITNKSSLKNLALPGVSYKGTPQNFPEALNSNNKSMTYEEKSFPLARALIREPSRTSQVENVVSTLLPTKGTLTYENSGLCQPLTRAYIKEIDYILKTNEKLYVNFEMKKTEIIDVYKLYLLEKINEGTNEINLEKCLPGARGSYLCQAAMPLDKGPISKYKKKCVGIAYIPTIQCSIMCQELFNNNLKKIVKCQFIIDKKKWVPIEENISKNLPDIISDLEDKIQLIEIINCSDDE